MTIIWAAAENDRSLYILSKIFFIEMLDTVDTVVYDNVDSCLLYTSINILLYSLENAKNAASCSPVSQYKLKISYLLKE